MKTVSYSIDEETKKGIEAMAKARRVSRSDVVREMYAYFRLKQTTARMQKQAAPLLKKLGLETEEDIALYAKSKT